MNVSNRQVTYANELEPAWRAPPNSEKKAPNWIFAFRPKKSHDHIMKSVPTAPPALKTPLAVEIAGVVMVAYPGSPSGGRLK
jgi:hypothetical protein